jgi:hypothetical protein
MGGDDRQRSRQAPVQNGNCLNHGTSECLVTRACRNSPVFCRNYACRLVVISFSFETT